MRTADVFVLDFNGMFSFVSATKLSLLQIWLKLKVLTHSKAPSRLLNVCYSCCNVPKVESQINLICNFTQNIEIRNNTISDGLFRTTVESRVSVKSSTLFQPCQKWNLRWKRRMVDHYYRSYLSVLTVDLKILISYTLLFLYCWCVSVPAKRR